MALETLGEDETLELPWSVLEAVDRGENPQAMIREQVQTLVDKNQKTHGRIVAIQQLKEQLEKSLLANQLL